MTCHATAALSHSDRQLTARCHQPHQTRPLDLAFSLAARLFDKWMRSCFLEISLNRWMYVVKEMPCSPPGGQIISTIESISFSVQDLYMSLSIHLNSSVSRYR